MQLDQDCKRRRGAQLFYRDALVSFIHKRGHGAVHPAPVFLCCKSPGLMLGYLATSSVLVLVANPLLTMGTACSSNENNTWEGGGAWNRILSLRHFLPLLRHEGKALESLVLVKSESGWSEPRSRDLRAKTLGSWGLLSAQHAVG